MSSIKNKTLIIVLSAATFAMAAVGGYFYISARHNDTSSNSSITKVEESGEEPGTVDVSLKYSGYVTLLTEENLITLNFTNPAKSKKTLSLEIVADINGESITLAETDKISPGNKIDSVKYDLDKKIEKGNYKGSFVVHFYDGEKEEIVNSKIGINIYVK